MNFIINHHVFRCQKVRRIVGVEKEVIGVSPFTHIPEDSVQQTKNLYYLAELIDLDDYDIEQLERLKFEKLFFGSTNEHDSFAGIIISIMEMEHGVDLRYCPLSNTKTDIIYPK